MESSQEKGGVFCVVDSDIVIDLLRQRNYARQLMRRWAGQGLLAVSVLTHLEVYQGMRASEEDATNTFFDSLESIEVSAAIAQRAGKLLHGLRSRGITIGIADAIIAATALEMGLPLLTNNVAHYPFPGLRVVRGVEE